MKRKIVKREDISALNIKPKRIDVEKVFRLIKKIGRPFDKDDIVYGRYPTTQERYNLT